VDKIEDINPHHLWAVIRLEREWRKTDGANGILSAIHSVDPCAMELLHLDVTKLRRI